MANPQLTGYIKQQLGLGDNETSIKTNLRSVGWAEADITEAFKEVSPSPVAPVVPAIKPAAPSMPSMPQTTQPMANPSPAMPNLSASPSAPKGVAPMESRKINLENFAPMSSPSPMVRPFSASPAVMSFTAQKPMDNIFQPKTMAPGAPGMAAPGMNPSPMAVSPMASTPATSKKSWGSIVVMILMALLIVGLGGLSWFLYQNNTALKTQVQTITTQLSSIAGQVSNTSESLSSQIAALQDQNQDLDSQLGLFLAKSTSTAATVTLKGVVGGGGKVSYNLTTSKGIVVSVKNSKDTKIIATLSPLVGLSATLTGTQTAGSREITVTLVNGTAPVELVVATSTASTTNPNPIPPTAPVH